MDGEEKCFFMDSKYPLRITSKNWTGFDGSQSQISDIDTSYLETGITFTSARAQIDDKDEDQNV